MTKVVVSVLIASLLAVMGTTSARTQERPTNAAAASVKPPAELRGGTSDLPHLYEGVSVEKLLEEGQVLDETGADAGDIESLIFGSDGKILAIIVEIGGYFEAGGTHVSVPWTQIIFGENDLTVTVPFKQAGAADYPPLEVSEDLDAAGAAEIRIVNEDHRLDPAGKLFRARDLLGDHAYIQDNFRWGFVNDLVLYEGRLTAIVIEVAAQGPSRHYAVPFNSSAEVEPTLGRYTFPFDKDQIHKMAEFDYDRFIQRNGPVANGIE